jgi:hypothetical protein
MIVIIHSRVDDLNRKVALSQGASAYHAAPMHF